MQVLRRTIDGALLNGPDVAIASASGCTVESLSDAELAAYVAAKQSAPSGTMLVMNADRTFQTLRYTQASTDQQTYAAWAATVPVTGAVAVPQNVVLALGRLVGAL